jgi:hypothetical protein
MAVYKGKKYCKQITQLFHTITLLCQIGIPSVKNTIETGAYFSTFFIQLSTFLCDTLRC